MWGNVELHACVSAGVPSPCMFVSLNMVSKSRANVKGMEEDICKSLVV